MSLPASQLATYLANQLVIQKATTQVVNKTVVFECRYCLAKFLSNSQLYYYIRESHGKKTVLLIVHSVVKNSAPSSASRIILFLSIPLATFVTTSYVQIANRATLRPVTLSSIYRTISPPLSIYQATSKAYFIVQDLYMRYVPLKFIYLAKLVSKTCVASYLTVQDLYKQFEKFSKKPHSNIGKWTSIFIVNRTIVFGSKQLSKSALLVSKASIKNIDKVVYSIVKSLYSQIGPSVIKPVFVLKFSQQVVFLPTNQRAAIINRRPCCSHQRAILACFILYRIFPFTILLQN